MELEPVRHPAEAHVSTGGGYRARVVNAGTVARWVISLLSYAEQIQSRMLPSKPINDLFCWSEPLDCDPEYSYVFVVVGGCGGCGRL